MYALFPWAHMGFTGRYGLFASGLSRCYRTILSSLCAWCVLLSQKCVDRSWWSSTVTDHGGDVVRLVIRYQVAYCNIDTKKRQIWLQGYHHITATCTAKFKLKSSQRSKLEGKFSHYMT